MKAFGFLVFIAVWLIMALQTSCARPGNDNQKGKGGRQCGRALSKIDALDLCIVFTNNSITMRKLPGNVNCIAPVGLECGVPSEVKEKIRNGKFASDKKGGAGQGQGMRNGTDMEGGQGQGQGQGQGGQGQGQGGQGQGQGGQGQGQGGQGQGGQQPGQSGSIKRDNTKVCQSFGQLTECYIPLIERLDDQMAVENSTQDIVFSQEDDDTPATPDVPIPGSQSGSGTVSSMYTTLTVTTPGRQEGTMCKGKLHIYIAAGKGNVTFEDIVSSIKKNQVKWSLEVTDPANWFCNTDNSGCASYIRLRVCLTVQNGKKEGLEKKADRACADDSNKKCGKALMGQDGTMMDVSNRVRIDGQRVTLEGDRGSVSIAEDVPDCIDVVIPRFETSFYLDPIVATSDAPEDLGGDASSMTKSGFLVVLLAVLGSMLIHL